MLFIGKPIGRSWMISRACIFFPHSSFQTSRRVSGGEKARLAKGGIREHLVRWFRVMKLRAKLGLGVVAFDGLWVARPRSREGDRGLCQSLVMTIMFFKSLLVHFCFLSPRRRLIASICFTHSYTWVHIYLNLLNLILSFCQQHI